MTYLNVDIEVDSIDIAEAVAKDWRMKANNYKELIEFIVDVDELVGDLQFTVALRDRLNEIIALEEDE